MLAQADRFSFTFAVQDAVVGIATEGQTRMATA
jgi:hypothetical protein